MCVCNPNRYTYIENSCILQWNIESFINYCWPNLYVQESMCKELWQEWFATGVKYNCFLLTIIFPHFVLCVFIKEMFVKWLFSLIRIVLYWFVFNWTVSNNILERIHSVAIAYVLFVATDLIVFRRVSWHIRLLVRVNFWIESQTK